MLLGAARADAITLPTDFQDTFVANANQPTSLAFVPGGRLLIAEEAGVVRVYENGALNGSPALDIRSRVCSLRRARSFCSYFRFITQDCTSNIDKRAAIPYIRCTLLCN